MKRVILTGVDGEPTYVYLAHIVSLSKDNHYSEIGYPLTEVNTLQGILLCSGAPEEIDKLIQEAYNND